LPLIPILLEIGNHEGHPRAFFEIANSAKKVRECYGSQVCEPRAILRASDTRGVNQVECQFVEKNDHAAPFEGVCPLLLGGCAVLPEGGTELGANFTPHGFVRGASRERHNRVERDDLRLLLEGNLRNQSGHPGQNAGDEHRLRLAPAHCLRQLENASGRPASGPIKNLHGEFLHAGGQNVRFKELFRLRLGKGG